MGIDGNSDGTTKDDDRRISKDEWAARAKTFSGHPFVCLAVCSDGGKGTDAVFAATDSDGKGMVLLKEFCEYLEAAEVAAGTLWQAPCRRRVDDVCLVNIVSDSNNVALVL